MSISSILLILLPLLPLASQAKESADFAERVIQEHALSPASAQRLKQILTSGSGTRNIGTEDLDIIMGPNHAVHPASRSSCYDKVIKTGLLRANPEFEKICGAKWMAPIPQRPGEPADQARTCIDQFEFPNMPCEYPLVWAPSSQAHQICQAMGKRVCNSHEWEGSCAGAIDENNPYLFQLSSLNQRRSSYNGNREQIWAFQWNPELRGATTRELCAIYSPHDPDLDPRLKGKTSQYYTAIGKSPTCHTPPSDYQNCGSHTWPAGMKYLCRTQNEVYDLHGNVAEVVNFPQTKAGLASGATTDHTERKGSFFVIRKDYPDDCRVRQPYEHFHDFSTDKHSYYQEGFRCCKDRAP